MTKNFSPAQLSSYEQEGFLFPFRVLAIDEVLRFRAALEELEDYLARTNQSLPLWQPHLHFRWAYELATHPAVLDLIETITGPNILVHTSSIFRKEPHDAASIPWHQDGYYWQLNAPRLVSAWIALSDSTVENGCMWVIPRTHHRRLPHRSVKHRENMLASGLSLAQNPDESGAVAVVLKAGEMSLHHLNLVHGSKRNRTEQRRIGFAVRYVSPEVSQRLQHHSVLLARGRDDFHNYELLSEPPTDNIEEGVARLAGLVRRIRESRLGEA
jgi:non-haem Fe2+, alpha-ketoglutarate-dependent halogenase